MASTSLEFTTIKPEASSLSSKSYIAARTYFLVNKQRFDRGHSRHCLLGQIIRYGATTASVRIQTSFRCSRSSLRLRQQHASWPETRRCRPVLQLSLVVRTTFPYLQTCLSIILDPSNGSIWGTPSINQTAQTRLQPNWAIRRNCSFNSHQCSITTLILAMWRLFVASTSLEFTTIKPECGLLSKQILHCRKDLYFLR